MDDHLSWRYATKKFDPAKKIPEQEFKQLLNVLRMAPSSYGLQPWKFVVVRDSGLRKNLKAHAWNQDQVTDASHLIILCALKTIDKKYINDFVNRIAKTRDVQRESLSQYEKMMLESLKSQTPEMLLIWMKHQVYIALGMLLMECAHQKIDACPMEGFDPKGFDKTLGLQEQGITSVVLCPVGYRSEDDRHAKLKKVRFENEELFIER